MSKITRAPLEGDVVVVLIDQYPSISRQTNGWRGWYGRLAVIDSKPDPRDEGDVNVVFAEAGTAPPTGAWLLANEYENLGAL